METTKPVSIPATTPYIPALTGLRAIAAYLVFLHHYNPAAPDTFVHRLLAQGYVGVSLFFVLSGFLIYHRYAPVHLANANWSWRTYLRNRFARVYPLYAVLLLLTAGANWAIGRPMSGPELILNATLLKGFFEDYTFSGIAQSWSLTVEACFYGLAPLLFVTGRRLGPLLPTAGLVAVGGLLWATVGALAWHGLFGSLSFVLFYTFFGRSFEFMAGMWLARQWHENRLPSARYATVWGLLIAGSCIVGQTILLSSTTDATVLRWGEFIGYNLVLPLGLTSLLLGLLREATVLRRVLAQSVMQALGRSSYAFYLIHVGVVAKGLQAAGLTHRGWLFGALVVLAHGLYLTIESPLHRGLMNNVR